MMNQDDPIVEDIDNYATYEEYLDAHISDQDMFFLQDRSMARRIFEMLLEGSAGLSRDKFLQFKEAQKQTVMEEEEESIEVMPDLGTIRQKGNPLLSAIWEHIDAIEAKELTPILFIRMKSNNGSEVSAFIDVADRIAKVWNRFVNSDLEQKQFIIKAY